MKRFLLLFILALIAVGCHKKVVKPFTEPLTFSETINGNCIDHFAGDNTSVYCRKPVGSDVATCYLIRPVKKDTPECQPKYIFPD